MNELEKELAAAEAVKLIQPNMVVGLGTGSTAAFMIKLLAERVKEGLPITAVSSSEASTTLATSLGITVVPLNKVNQIDITIDGADEFNPNLELIKGGGGALLREKIIAYNTTCNVIITDASKQVEKLGAFRLPIEVIPFAAHHVTLALTKMGLDPVVRQNGTEPYTTDEHNYILDTSILKQDNLQALEQKLKSIPGIVETGLFLNTTDMIIVGKNKAVEIIKRTEK